MSEISENNRYIDITDTLRVGYNFEKSMFYVTNKNTTTFRATVPLIQEVLRALDIENLNDNVLQALKDNLEVVTNIYYTWEDTGAYIKSIQFNEFSDYPIILDCEKSKLYIDNSTVLYDLTTNESPQVVRVPRLCSFYKDTLGLEISKELMLTLYNLLIKYYNPYCYNQIATREEITDPLKYNNIFELSNFTDSAYVTYTCIANPNNIFNPVNIDSIESMEADTNTIYLRHPISDENIKKYYLTTGSKVNVYNATIQDLGNTYSNDGTYTIEDIQENIIKVKENIPLNYSFPYLELYVESVNVIVTSMSRANSTITVSTMPSNLLIGDTIYIENAFVTTPFETISCNGKYTVYSIENNVITVEEEIPTDFTGIAMLTKETFISNIQNITNNAITLQNPTNITLQGSTVWVYNGDIKKSYVVTGQDIASGTVYVSSIEDYNPDYAQLQFPAPSPEIAVNVTYTKNEDVLPKGEFITDSFLQAKQYIETYIKAIPPTDETESNLYNYVPTTIELHVPNEETRILELKGLYTEIYK